jgi:hypothetical protein
MLQALRRDRKIVHWGCTENGSEGCSFWRFPVLLLDGEDFSLIFCWPFIFELFQYQWFPMSSSDCVYFVAYED